MRAAAVANPSLLVCGGAAAAVLLLARRRARAWSRPLRCTFRPATAEDVEGVARCWAEAYPDQGPDLQTLEPSFLAERTGAHMFRSRARERTADTLVACDSHGAVVGFCVCVGAGDTAEIEQLFLCARARGAGVAVSLLQRGEELLRARGSSHAHLYCFPKNEAAPSLQTLNNNNPNPNPNPNPKPKPNLDANANLNPTLPACPPFLRALRLAAAGGRAPARRPDLGRAHVHAAGQG